MALIKQIWTLMLKNWRCKMRHPAVTFIMAFLVPVLFGAFLSFARNLFVPPAEFGIADPVPIRSLASAFDIAKGVGRDKVVLVNSGFVGGNVDKVFGELEALVKETDSEIQVVRVEKEDDVVRECPSSLRGVTSCFNAIVMRSSPTEGPAGFWNYTIRTDSVFSSSPIRFNVKSMQNPSQVYMIPMQRTIDQIIGRLHSPDADPLADLRELPFTSMTQEERSDWIREQYQQVLIDVMGVTSIATIIWVTYHLTGFIATERESGMSGLIDAMMPVRHQWMAQAARIIAHHISFAIVYAPAWIISAFITRAGVFANTNIGIVLVLNILSGLALCSFAILVASFFKKAQLSGITSILVTILLGITAQSITAPGTGVVAALSLLLTPCTYVYFITAMSRFEKARFGASLTDTPPNSPWDLPLIVLWAFLIVQIFAYPLIAFFIERSLYGTTSKGRQVADGAALGNDHAVQLDGFTKIYKPSLFSRLFRKNANPVRAVDKLSFNVGRGQIVALLGANGSGKSTTLDAIAGLNKLTHGSIRIDGTGGLGIAPQKNVLWDDLTVEEHLRIFNRLKSPNSRATPQDLTDLIESIDLTKKRKALSKTLSGGQKRKLQLGMMLTGGSAVCCVDEVSSGIDPLSRKKLWDILLAERGKRTMILTTHFLDEADLLADEIAILSKGTLRARGSSVELKDKLGGGYKVHVQKSPDLKSIPDIEGVVKKETLDLITYNSPSSSLSAKVIKELEAAAVPDYRFSGPTIEDVFLNVAEEIRGEETQTVVVSGEKSTTTESGLDTPDESGVKLINGQHVGYLKQIAVLFTKRITIIKRNWLPYVIAFLLPILAAALTSLYIKGQAPPGCSPAEQASRRRTEDGFSQMSGRQQEYVFLVGPPTPSLAATVSELYKPILAGIGGHGAQLAQAALKNIKEVETFEQFQEFIVNNRKNVTTGLWLGTDDAPPTMAWLANLFVTSPITGLELLDMILTNTTIQTTWSPFEIPFSPQTGNSLNLVIYMGLALACYPAFFSLYPSNERRSFVRSLHYSNGVGPFPLWVAYTLFDFTIALISSAIVTAVWAAVSNIWFEIGYVFVVLFLYGLAAILMAYVVSLFTKTQLATYAWAAVLQAAFFLIYLIAYFCVETYSPVTATDFNLRLVHFVLSTVAPICSAIRALFLTLNLFSTACDGEKLSTNPSGILLYGGPILYLAVQCVALFGFLIWFDSGSAGSSLRGLFQRNEDKNVAAPTTDDNSDEEIATELNRVTSKGVDEHGLRVMNLTKSFKKNTAVDNVTFGIKKGEVFALLGPNGAGKSTTISLIRGDIKPSRNGGDVFVQDQSVSKNLAAARANLGVCPQFDALDHMTVREHLEFYAQVRGITDIQHNVAAILHAVGLEAFSTRMAHALSGGNKRKLSLGIALMGNPSVVVLDEPSSGLDAASKRIMWKTLAATVPGRSILLTTHSMEEADALAGRAGIMARRMLALGTPDDLRHRFGHVLHIHLVCANAPRTSQDEMDRVITWVKHNFPTAQVEEKTYHGQLRFSVAADQVLAARDVATTSNGNDSSAIGSLTVLLEESKEELGVGYYSVSPTTLDQVFLAIVGKHNIQEEGYEDKKQTSVWKKLLGR